MFGTLCSLRQCRAMAARAVHHAIRINIRLALVLAVAVGAFSFAGAAQAIPVQLDAAQFTSQTGGLTVAVENFTGYANTLANPLTFSNGTFNGGAGGNPLVLNGNFYCRGGGWCLTDFGSHRNAKTINGLPAGTQFWGTDFTIGSGGIGRFDITVTGVSGILELTDVFLEDVNFLGFFDVLGILEISIVNKGIKVGNSTRYPGYGIDNVRTADGFAAAAAVPEPGTLALFALGLLGLGIARRRKAA